MKTKSPPPLTVGLPVYNGERFLAGAIESILEQTYGDLELLVSDNASTDATEEICRDFARRDSRMRYHRHSKNCGGAWNFNFVVHRAESRLFRFAAHDDLQPVEILHELADGPVTLGFAKGNCTIKAASGSFRIAAGDPADFPGIEVPDASKGVEVDREVLKDLVGRTAFAAAALLKRHARATAATVYLRMRLFGVSRRR